MSVQDNIDLVKQGYAAFARGDMETLLGLFAEEIEWAVPAIAGAPFGGTVRGLDAVAGFFRALTEAEDFQEFTQEDFIAQGNRVVVTGRSRALVRATGRTLELQFVHLFTVGEGKVRRFVEFFDTAAASEAYRQATGAGA